MEKNTTTKHLTNKIMKITIENYGKKFSVETTHEDVDINEYLEIYYGMLIQLTFNSETIKNGLMELTDLIEASEI
jgi:hypothetical protein